MPEPVPEPTPGQLVTVQDITLLTYDEVEAMVAADSVQAVSNAKWAQTLADITVWTKIRTKAGNIKKVGSIEFFESGIGQTRLSFRNMIRARYGQDLLISETGPGMTEVSSLEWY